ncbi:biotin--[acetyl-CoA-carboxylase] ligase [Marinicrinis sediminis]|uniref:Bifunctional ligase/repressor BirA n=1 Tax=Marinicrinis sediminis TaxID=1652465 RepID=A0ABW5REA7_9BACL
MNHDILQWFKNQPQTFISGEEISKQFGVSRTAVWKHIEQLRKAGYKIEAVPRKGYRLVESPAFFQTVRFVAALKTKKLGTNLRVFESLDSTQTRAFEEARKGAPEGTLVWTEMQTGGKGRRGRAWHSPPYKGLWFSFIVHPRIPLQFTPQLTLLTAVAICRVLRRKGIECGIKWPNDLYIEGKKCGGILLETTAEDERVQVAIGGIGLSVNLDAEDYPETLRDQVISLKMATGKSWDRELLLADILKEIEDFYLIYLEQGFEPIRILWEALSIHMGEQVEVETIEGRIGGRTRGVNSLGALILEQADGRRQEVYSGDLIAPF